MTGNENNKNSESLKQHDAASDFGFLQEKIKERPINKKKLIKRTIITALMAVLFGLLACLSFVLLEPVLNNLLYPEEEPAKVAFPPEQKEMLPEDMLTEGTTAQMTGIDEKNENHSQQTDAGNAETQGAETDDSQGNAGNADALPPEAQEPPLKPYQTQYEELYKAYGQISSSMVTVTAMHSDVDWFNNTYQSEGTTAGVVVANNNKELLILSKKSPLDTAESISITFCNGVEADASIKKHDASTNLAILAVDLKYVSSATLENVSVASLGSSASSGILGTPVIAVGNLFGYKDNVCYGMVTSKGNSIEIVDNEYKLITTDIYASENPSGILANLAGEVIGIVENGYNNPDTKNLLSAVGITELKGMIAKLSNGEDIPYLGIYAKDITVQARAETGLPQGAYVAAIDMDSPAMTGGIQRGDVIVQVGNHDIHSAKDYMDALRESAIEKNLKVTIQRADVNSYREIAFTVQPINRE